MLDIEVSRVLRSAEVRNGKSPESASSEESCIRRAVNERGLTSDLVGPADASSEDEAATGTAFALM